MAYELTGKVKLIQDEQTFGSGFKKREMVVIVEDGKYPQEINLEFVQDKISLLNDLSPGQKVTVAFDIRGREYNGRYYNNLQGWKVAGADDHDNFNQEPPPPDSYDSFDSSDTSDSSDSSDSSDFDDDIPF